MLVAVTFTSEGGTGWAGAAASRKLSTQWLSSKSAEVAAERKSCQLSATTRPGMGTGCGKSSIPSCSACTVGGCSAVAARSCTTSLTKRPGRSGHCCSEVHCTHGGHPEHTGHGKHELPKAAVAGGGQPPYGAYARRVPLNQTIAACAGRVARETLNPIPCVGCCRGPRSTLAPSPWAADAAGTGSAGGALPPLAASKPAASSAARPLKPYDTSSEAVGSRPSAKAASSMPLQRLSSTEARMAGALGGAYEMANPSPPSPPPINKSSSQRKACSDRPGSSCAQPTDGRRR